MKTKQHVLKPIVQALNGHAKDPNLPAPTVFVDCGGNIGWFSTNALAMGATVITFEPMRKNLGIMVATVRRNQWQDRHYLYHNALHWEPVRVTMKPTDADINLSNGHVTGTQCPKNLTQSANLQYGVDYMDAVTLDQVMFSRHADIRHVAAMKLDIKRFEPQALNGAMRFLCNRIVHSIVMEIQYLKSNAGPHECNVNDMLRTLEHMGYHILSPKGRNFTGLDVNKIPDGDVVFQLRNVSQTPWERLAHGNAEPNPCAGLAC